MLAVVDQVEKKMLVNFFGDALYKLIYHQLGKIQWF